MIRQLNTIRVFLLLTALFLLAQSTAQLHSVDHLFHHDGPSCMAFHSMQHHSGALFDHSFKFPAESVSTHYQVLAEYRVDNIRHHFATSRAPPSV